MQYRVCRESHDKKKKKTKVLYVLKIPSGIFTKFESFDKVQRVYIFAIKVVL